MSGQYDAADDYPRDEEFEIIPDDETPRNFLSDEEIKELDEMGIADINDNPTLAYKE